MKSMIIGMIDEVAIEIKKLNEKLKNEDLTKEDRAMLEGERKYAAVLIERYKGSLDLGQIYRDGLKGLTIPKKYIGIDLKKIASKEAISYDPGILEWTNTIRNKITADIKHIQNKNRNINVSPETVIRVASRMFPFRYVNEEYVNAVVCIAIGLSMIRKIIANGISFSYLLSKPVMLYLKKASFVKEVQERMLTDNNELIHKPNFDTMEDKYDDVREYYNSIVDKVQRTKKQNIVIVFPKLSEDLKDVSKYTKDQLIDLIKESKCDDKEKICLKILYSRDTMNLLKETNVPYTVVYPNENWIDEYKQRIENLEEFKELHEYCLKHIRDIELEEDSCIAIQKDETLEEIYS